MPLLSEWGEKIDFSCVCVAETVLLLLLLSLLLPLLMLLCTLSLWWIPCTCSPPTPYIHSACNQIRIWNPVGGLWWSFFCGNSLRVKDVSRGPCSSQRSSIVDVWRNFKYDSVWGKGFHHWDYTEELLFRGIYIANVGFV